MYYELKKIPDLPILLGTWYEGFKFINHGEEYIGKVDEQLNLQKSPVFYILDLSHLHTMSIEGAMKSTDSGARGANPNLRHPMNRGNIFVSKADLVKMVVQGLRSPLYGNLDVKLFDRLNEAIAYIKEQT